MILAIDPGTTESGWVTMDGMRVMGAGVCPNADMLGMIRRAADAPDSPGGVETLAIEMIANYGMAVGREVFETCVWVGRMQQTWRDPESVRMVYRRDVKMHLCGSARAKDANIRAALIDKFGPGKDVAVGRKPSPGPLYGVKSHAWAALAVAVTVLANQEAIHER